MISGPIDNDRELLKLQKKYRNRLIKEKDLSSEELQRLKELYKKQIDYLENYIENDKKEILNLRRKIGK